MSQTVFLDLLETQSRWVDDLYGPWEGGEDVAKLAPFLEKSIPTLVSICGLMEKAYPPLCRSLFDNLAEEGALVPGTRYYDTYHRIFHAVEASAKILNDAKSKGAEVRDLGALDEAVEKFRRLLDEKIEGLPRIDHAAIALSREEYRQGHYISLREWIDELRGRPEPIGQGAGPGVEITGPGPIRDSGANL